jgi:hypothetical protein
MGRETLHILPIQHIYCNIRPMKIQCSISMVEIHLFKDFLRTGNKIEVEMENV